MKINELLDIARAKVFLLMEGYDVTIFLTIIITIMFVVSKKIKYKF
jgi:hypothetical protein